MNNRRRFRFLPDLNPACVGAVALGLAVSSSLTGCVAAKDPSIAGTAVNGLDWVIIGVDPKVGFNGPGISFLPPTQDYVVLLDITDPASPTTAVELELDNSVFGPPTNLAVSPDGSWAVVANAVNWVPGEDEGSWKPDPDNRLHLIDLTTSPPSVTGTVQAGGLQPSGLAFSRDGKWLAVANRKDQTLSVFAARPGGLTLRDTVAVEGQAAAVAFAPDNQTILVTKFSEHLVAVVDHADGKLNYDSANDIPVGRWPYNLQIAPDNSIALIANTGNKGLPDGHQDSVTVVDLTVSPPKVIDHVTVGDGPEGIAISPRGDLALVPLLQGSAPMFAEEPFFNKTGRVVVLSIDGKNVEVVGSVDVGRFPEGVGFSADGSYAYVGDLVDNQVTVLKIDGRKVTKVGKPIPLPGPPGSLRTTHP